MRTSPGGTLAGRLRVVWSGASETDCVETCRDLQLAGIEYRVSQTPVGRSGRMGVVWRFEIAVSNSEYAAAREALNLDAEEDGPLCQNLELKETDDALNADSGGGQARVEAYLKPWCPEDATVEVGSQSASDTSSIVELSLTENLVHYRVDRGKNGSRRYFVVLGDERRAREILRQIERGEPSD